jgi:hypothetical protein
VDAVEVVSFAAVVCPRAAQFPCEFRLPLRVVCHECSRSIRLHNHHDGHCNCRSFSGDLMAVADLMAEADLMAVVACCNMGLAAGKRWACRI